MKKIISSLLSILMCAAMLGCTNEVSVTGVSENSVYDTSTTIANISENSVYGESSTILSISENGVNSEPSVMVAASENSVNSAKATTAADTPKSDILTLTVKDINSWEEGGKPVTQFDVIIHNNEKYTIIGWEVTLNIGENASLKDSWNAKIAIKNGVLTASPMDYNATIEPGKDISFGMIIKDPGDVKKSHAEPGKTTQSSSSNGTNSAGNGTTSGNGDNSPPPPPALNLDVPPPTTDDWLFTKGNKIVDKNGKEVWLTGVNWFGYNTGTNTFDGLWSADLNSSVASIADHGFNLLRIPFSVELIKNWSEGEYPQANFNQATNSYLVGMNSLEIFDYVVSQCRANGMKIMIDIHSAATDAMGHMDADWISGNITEKDFLDALSWMAERYKDDDTIIAYDLKNEPHGKANENPRVKWDDSSDADNWRYIAEKAALAVLKKNPNVLIMVEGIEIYPINIKENGDFTSTNPGDYYGAWWGGNLRGVADNPVNLGKYNNKLVYSPHDYGPAVYAQTWFQGDFTFDSIMEDYWHDSWFYIQKENIAPLLIGEWGGFMTEPNLKWMTLMRRLIK
jgi:aryl-phospho-beta-D-glucosidase BglC (GH1 family)